MKKNDYFSDLITPQIEMNSTFRNYKAIRIEVMSDLQSGFQCSVDSEEKIIGNNLKHIFIDKYLNNKKEMSIPIATFMPINN